MMYKLSSGSGPGNPAGSHTSSMADEIKLVELQCDKLVLELEVLKRCNVARQDICPRGQRRGGPQ